MVIEPLLLLLLPGNGKYADTVWHSNQFHFQTTFHLTQWPDCWKSKRHSRDTTVPPRSVILSLSGRKTGHLNETNWGNFTLSNYLRSVLLHLLHSIGNYRPVTDWLTGWLISGNGNGSGMSIRFSSNPSATNQSALTGNLRPLPESAMEFHIRFHRPVPLAFNCPSAVSEVNHRWDRVANGFQMWFSYHISFLSRLEECILKESTVVDGF